MFKINISKLKTLIEDSCQMLVLYNYDLKLK